MTPKRSALGEPEPEPDEPGPSDQGGSASPTHASVTLTLINPTGLHARPAAQLATALGQLDAEVVVAANGRTADGASSLELLTLGTEQGSEITVSASGPDAQRAVDTARTLVEDGFGELEQDQPAT
ncbi:HPr family phosphocarrier protein [Nocardioides sp. HDW12B]|uniref:HPr family phosphocarrier protein n=1 Tax=Nocardioides sp. HDW12B TaxID=2714939 RepID=UPI003211F638